MDNRSNQRADSQDGGRNGSGTAGLAMVAMAREPIRWVEQVCADRIVVTNERVAYTPLVTLKDGFNGVAHIVRSEGCYVLIVGNYVDGFGVTTHWFKDAVASLVKLAASIVIEIRS